MTTTPPLNPPVTVVECYACRGAGELEVPARSPLDDWDTAPCFVCHGAGTVEVEWCGRPGCPRPAVPGLHDHGVNLCTVHQL